MHCGREQSIQRALFEKESRETKRKGWLDIRKAAVERQKRTESIETQKTIPGNRFDARGSGLAGFSDAVNKDKKLCYHTKRYDSQACVGCSNIMKAAAHSAELYPVVSRCVRESA